MITFDRDEVWFVRGEAEGGGGGIPGGGGGGIPGGGGGGIPGGGGGTPKGGGGGGATPGTEDTIT